MSITLTDVPFQISKSKISFNDFLAALVQHQDLFMDKFLDFREHAVDEISPETRKQADKILAKPLSSLKNL